MVAAIGPRPVEDTRVGQQRTTTRVWARRGTRPRAVRDTCYLGAYIFGAICPQRGVGAGLVLPRADTEAMTLHLAEIAATVAPGAHAALILDGARWYRGDDLVVPPNLTLLKLPPYAPELNSAENLWEYLRKNNLAPRISCDYDAIVGACCSVRNNIVTAPALVTSVTRRARTNAS